MIGLNYKRGYDDTRIMSREYQPFNDRSLKNFGDKDIKLKYFIMIVTALLLEVLTLTIYLLNNETIIHFDLFSAGVLYGTTSVIIVAVSVGCLVVMRIDKKKDKKKIYHLLGFKNNYQELVDKYSKEIDRFEKGFDGRSNNIDLKINWFINGFGNKKSSAYLKTNYAIALEEIFNSLLKEFSKIKISKFLNNAFKYAADHISKEKLFYSSFSSSSGTDELQKISKESNSAYRNFTREIDQLEKSLKLTV